MNTTIPSVHETNWLTKKKDYADYSIRKQSLETYAGELEHSAERILKLMLNR